jgi:hypothetical protein
MLFCFGTLHCNIYNGCWCNLLACWFRTKIEFDINEKWCKRENLTSLCSNNALPLNQSCIFVLFVINPHQIYASFALHNHPIAKFQTHRAHFPETVDYRNGVPFLSPSTDNISKGYTSEKVHDYQ